jgi:hypothetical protein
MRVFKEGIRIRIIWESSDEEDVEKARDFFTKLTRQGWLTATYDGEYRRILDFKTDYGELWFIPISEGG